MGEGQCWGPDGASQVDAAELLAARHLKPLALGPKDGLALINGTQMMTALGAEAVCRAKYAALAADVACALTVEALKGTHRAFDARIHAARPHAGQGAVAARLRKLLLPPSALWTSHAYAGRVQDPYTMRCAPQVHGVAHDTIAFVEGLLDVEINSATDNPMIFAGESPDAPAAAPPDPPPPPKAAPTDEVERLRAENEELRARLAGRGAAGTRTKSASDTCYAGGGAVIISGGNFHGAERPRPSFRRRRFSERASRAKRSPRLFFLGEYPAKACDYLAIGVAELANISERRTERLMNPDLSELPAFLTADGGFNSGFMIAHCTAAALASENKVLCHPASADSLSTSAAKEDHVSMGGFAARKALDVVANVEHVVAIEILAACQAIEFHRPLRTTPVLERVHALVRGVAAKWDRDRAMAPDIAAVRDLIRDGALHDAVAPDLA